MVTFRQLAEQRYPSPTTVIATRKIIASVGITILSSSDALTRNHPVV
jgi:hypothetical protein